MEKQQAYEKVVRFFKERSANYEISFECDDFLNLGIQRKSVRNNTDSISLGVYPDHIEYRHDNLYDPAYVKEALRELRRAGFKVQEIKDLPRVRVSHMW